MPNPAKTSALVSVLVKGKVVLKFVTGKRGSACVRLSAALYSLKSAPTPKEAYDLAIKVGFGDKTSLVVVGENEIVYAGNTCDLNPFFRSKFHVANFDPRTETGKLTGQYKEIKFKE